MNIGYNIREHRIKQNLSQAELATLIGYESSSIISMWESGDRTPPTKKLSPLAKMLDCEISDLFKDTKPLLPTQNTS